MVKRGRGITGIGLAMLFAGCAVNPPQPPADSAAVRCLELYSALDAVVGEVGNYPVPAPARLASFPYLRVDRFLSSFRTQSLRIPPRPPHGGHG